MPPPPRGTQNFACSGWLYSYICPDAGTYRIELHLAGRRLRPQAHDLRLGLWHGDSNRRPHIVIIFSRLSNNKDIILASSVYHNMLNSGYTSASSLQASEHVTRWLPVRY